MPYVDVGAKICRPTEYQKVEKGDIILVYPATLKINKQLIQFPPLSVISENCKNLIESPNWVDGYIVKGNERIEFLEGRDLIKGEIKVHENLLTAFTLKKLLPKELEIKILKIKVKAQPIISVQDVPLVYLAGNLVIIPSVDYKKYLELFAYSLYYYISSSADDRNISI
ncbi:hypothetical protein SUSAZ_06330 [Sulfolobus acidocaldarius SUSAZ]|nr:hypothetical protein SUSAZ_06330 [Sulfolobus acidocaldarius SUSAZ]